MNRKRLTLIEVLAVVVILGLLTTVAIVGVSSMINNSKKTYYKTEERSVLEAGKSYFRKSKSELPLSSDSSVLEDESKQFINNIKSGQELVGTNNTAVVTLDTLVGDGFHEEIKDSKGGDSCKGFVRAVKETDTKYYYDVYLKCFDYESSLGKVDTSSGGSTDTLTCRNLSITTDVTLDTWTNKDVTITITRTSGTTEKVTIFDTLTNQKVVKEFGESGTTSIKLSQNNSYETGEHKILIAEGDESTDGCSITLKVDKTVPVIPTVKLYKWKANAEENRPTTETGLTGYTVDSWSNLKIFTKPSGSTDTGSGFDHYEYTTTGTTSNEEDYKASYRNVEADGTSKIKYRACDKAGNCSEYSPEYTIKIDKVIPTITGKLYLYDSTESDAKVTTTEATSGTWYKVPISRVLTVSDATSGIEKTQYCVKSTDCNVESNWKQENNMTYKYNQTNNNAYWRTIDKAGNISNKLEFSILVDWTAPNCGTWSGESTSWTAGNRTITLGAGTDATSGINNSAKGNSWTYTSTTKTAALSYTIRDNAGNTRVCSKTANVYVDTTPPTISASYSCSAKGGVENWCRATQTITCKCSDAESGVKEKSVSKEFTKEKENGSKKIGTCEDKVGNTATCTQTVKIDKTAPTLTDYRYVVNKTNESHIRVYPYVYYPGKWPGKLKIKYTSVTSSDSLSGVYSYYAFHEPTLISGEKIYRPTTKGLADFKASNVPTTQTDCVRVKQSISYQDSYTTGYYCRKNDFINKVQEYPISVSTNNWNIDWCSSLRVYDKAGNSVTTPPASNNDKNIVNRSGNGTNSSCIRENINTKKNLFSFNDF